ncbi:hypothetical protein AB0J14_28590 [Micromonospora arborensis]|uniref:5-methylcytosine restriction system specificity protein McrC n=1 Tax=Micromonospora arborensis TaxID=2116518 RepID=UPI0033E5F998
MIQLRDYQPDLVELTHDEASELTALAKGSGGPAGRPRVIERVTVGEPNGWYRIQPGPYVGRFALRSGRVIDITSRFPFENVAELLGLAERTTLLEEAGVDAVGGHGLVDLIGLAFVREAERLVGAGLAKGYASRTFVRPPYAGAPDVAAHLGAGAGLPTRLVTRANRLTMDIPINRLVAAAHAKLSRMTYQNPQLSARLRALAPVFAQISGWTEGRPRLPATTVPPQYRNVSELSYLVLDDRTALPVDSGVTGVSVLFNMTRIWELYVGNWLTRQLSAGQTVAPRYPIPLTDSGAEIMGTADFVLLEGDRPASVYDAKYRKWKDRPSTDELYQLVTYAHRLRLRHAGLVYPGSRSETTRVTVGDITLESIAIPVTSSET